MRFLIVALFLFFQVVHVFAQEPATISGKVVVDTNVPLEFATVALYTQHTQLLVSGGITNSKGVFILRGIPKGAYTIKCSYVGFEADLVSVLVGDLNTTYDVGKIELVPIETHLTEVQVAAQKSILSSALDKKSVEMSDNFAQSAGSVTDVMRNLPGVTVTQEGKVLLRGSDKVAILMDGKQSSLTGFGNQKGLDNIPASSIERIEIINNPSAKYDASGMAGIINIIYKKDKEEGFSGDVGFAYCLGNMTPVLTDLPTQLGSYTFTPKYMPSVSLHYKTKRISAHEQGELVNQKKLPNNEFTTRYYNDGRITASQVPENRTQNHSIFKGGLDWFVNNKNTFTIAGMYDYEHHFDTAQVPYINMASGKRYRYWNWLEDEETGYANVSAHYKHSFEQAGHELNAGFTYTKGWEDESYFLNDSSSVRPLGGRDTTHILATEYTTQATVDYVRPLKWGRVEVGTKLQWRSIPVTYTVGRGNNSNIYEGLGDWSKWNEEIYAAYANFVFDKPKYSIEAGLRAEQTDVSYSIDETNSYYPGNDAYDYLELFPNVRVSYKWSDGFNVSAFYNRRVDRPGEPELRIFPKYDDPELLKVGNPYLRPQFTQSFEVAAKYRWETGSVFGSVYHRIIDNPYQRIYVIDTLNQNYDIVNKIYQNVGSANNTGFEILFDQKLYSWWKINGSLNVYENRVNAYAGNVFFPYERTFSIVHTLDNTWDAKLNNQFQLPAHFNLQLSAIYFAPKNIPQGKQFARSSVDIGLKKQVLKGKGEILFSFSDVFNQFGIHQELSGDGFRTVYENRYETQVARIGLKYKF